MALKTRKTGKVARRPKPMRRPRREREEVDAPVASSQAFTVDKVTLNTGAQRPVLILEMTPVRKMVVKLSGGKPDKKSAKLMTSLLSAIPGGGDEETVGDEEDLEEEETEEEEDDEDLEEDEEDGDDEDLEEEDEDDAPKAKRGKKPVAKKPIAKKGKKKLDLDELTEELEDEGDDD